MLAKPSATKKKNPKIRFSDQSVISYATHTGVSVAIRDRYGSGAIEDEGYLPCNVTYPDSILQHPFGPLYPARSGP